MPIYKKQDMNSNTSLWVWHITEEEANLSRQLILTQNCINRLKKHASLVAQKRVFGGALFASSGKYTHP
jgi:hypothetical protein